MRSKDARKRMIFFRDGLFGLSAYPANTGCKIAEMIPAMAMMIPISVLVNPHPEDKGL